MRNVYCRSRGHMAKQTASKTPVASPTDFQKPATGFPRRMESTLDREYTRRQLSQFTGR